MIQNFTFWHIPQSAESWKYNRYLYSHVYSSIIHNSQKVDITRVP